MKALSLWQPWASLWACGRKTYETRSWSTAYGGQLLVHAAKRICTGTEIDDELYWICEEQFGLLWPKTLPAGALIGICDRVICKPTETLHPDADERAQGNFTPGRYGWGPINMRELPTPIPWRGMQQLFDVPDHIITGGAPANDPQGKLL